MSWIKRNLYFLVGGIVAVGLLGFAGFYFFSKWKLQGESLATLDAKYNEWKQIAVSPKHPGNDKVDNIKLAQEHKKLVQDKIQKASRFFAPIPPVPDPADETVAKQDFAAAFRSALRVTVDQLQKDAASSGVTLPPACGFSFKAEQKLYNLAPGSVGPLSVQLGEIKTICNILFQAKVNSLESIRRERVSGDDLAGPPTDYLEPTLMSVTNELAVLTPYEITFKCFTTELAAVLAGFASQPFGVIVKTVNVEPGTGMSMTAGLDNLTPSPGAYPPGTYPPGTYPPGTYPTPPQPGAVPGAAPARGGLPTVLDEKQLKVTMVLDVVKLLPKK
jgi:hypothetical protein